MLDHRLSLDRRRRGRGGHFDRKRRRRGGHLDWRRWGRGRAGHRLGRWG
jgi:hypothetical protein